MCYLACPAFVSAEDKVPEDYYRIYSKWTGTDFYHEYQDGEYRRYLVSADALQVFSCVTNGDSINVEYRQGTLQGKYGHLNEPEDFLKLEMPVNRLSIRPSWHLGEYRLSPQFTVGDGFGMKLNAELPGKASSKQVELGVMPQHAEVSYRIGAESGAIPFAWNVAQAGLKGSFGAYHSEMDIYGIYPGKGDSLLDNRLYGMGIATDTKRSLSGQYILGLSSFYGIAAARLNYRSEEYGRLDNFQLGYLALGAQKLGNSFESSFKLHACLTGSGADTYFDIWPFTFWDTFLASRTRLKKLHMYLISPEIAGTWKWGQTADKVQGSLGLSYSHLFHHEDVIHKNRIVILYPFFYGYETFRYDWHDEVDALVRIPLKLSYKIPSGSIGLSLVQVLPFRWSKLFADSGDSEPVEPDGDKAFKWGGLSGALQLNLSF